MFLKRASWISLVALALLVCRGVGAQDRVRLGLSSISATSGSIWVAEEKALLALRQFVGTRLYYRHRAENTARKAGNISEWIKVGS